jgi:hypothetical protein
MKNRQKQIGRLYWRKEVSSAENAKRELRLHKICEKLQTSCKKVAAEKVAGKMQPAEHHGSRTHMPIDNKYYRVRKPWPPSMDHMSTFCAS